MVDISLCILSAILMLLDGGLGILCSSLAGGSAVSRPLYVKRSAYCPALVGLSLLLPQSLVHIHLYGFCALLGQVPLYTAILSSLVWFGVMHTVSWWWLSRSLPPQSFPQSLFSLKAYFDSFLLSCCYSMTSGYKAFIQGWQLSDVFQYCCSSCCWTIVAGVQGFQSLVSFIRLPLRCQFRRSFQDCNRSLSVYSGSACSVTRSVFHSGLMLHESLTSMLKTTQSVYGGMSPQAEGRFSIVSSYELLTLSLITRGLHKAVDYNDYEEMLQLQKVTCSSSLTAASLLLELTPRSVLNNVSIYRDQCAAAPSCRLDYLLLLLLRHVLAKCLCVGSLSRSHMVYLPFDINFN
ncbi:hypothetical protein MIR68_010141 [Amoeboaphelidium protococcarum]|nr:hypothetical protein MIR68_010141 [Amoeboaphelidium protococcarum]